MMAHGEQGLHGPQAQGHDGASVRSMFDRIAPTYDKLNHLLSAGVDRAWRTELARELPDPCGRVLDLCAGTLDLGHAIWMEHPEAKVTAADFAVEMLRRGRNKLPDALLCGADALALPFKDESFDVAVCGFGVRNVSDLAACFREVRRVLKPGGTFAILEFFRPEKAITRAFHSLYNRRVLPTVGAAVSGDGDAYRYLAESMERFHSLAEAKELLASCGYRDVRGRDLLFGVASILSGARA
ncbi:ubiquinone/menaquinone biosynthesis methyltransferase [Vulgatibacter incomptus]|uniref:Demethylmenaquinone methyltransferase n=1 Tax=Vulgatibacter incomptus TaxID=1391653 RepID=A0A0K1P9P0_9BACT|nr:ubiquinone/menaquinone biosynthesis methyltransferase [Vulgatibacter incomptus]AKU89829.1 2-heptaprenyl-1,4-naphthoquinone methyltransferase [Vulgatibacter incomptus]